MSKQTTAYLYEGSNLLKEYTGEGSPLAEYNNANGQVISRKMFGFHGRKEYGTEGNIRTRGGLLYYHYDALGNVTDLTDHLGQDTIKYRWDAFGGMFAGTLAPYSHMGITGKEYDASTGLVFFGSRWYDPLAGRFTMPDSFMGRINLPNTLNSYAYALNNPIKYIDPTGHDFVIPTPEECGKDNTKIGSDGYTDYIRYVREQLLKDGNQEGSENEPHHDKDRDNNPSTPPPQGGPNDAPVITNNTTSLALINDQQIDLNTGVTILNNTQGADGAGHVGIMIIDKYGDGHYYSQAPWNDEKGLETGVPEYITTQTYDKDKLMNLFSQPGPITINVGYKEYNYDNFVHIKTSSSQADEMINEAEYLCKRGYNYNVITNNCVQFTDTVLSSANVKTTGAIGTIPNDYEDNLQYIYGNDSKLMPKNYPTQEQIESRLAASML